MDDTQVAVVGGGFVGLLTALGLARAGIGVTVLDAATGVPTTGDPVVFHWSVLPGLDRLGVLDAALGAGRTEQRWGFRVLVTGEQITFDLGNLASEMAHPFNLHVDRAALRDLLLGELATHPHARVETSASLTGLRQDDAAATLTVRQGDEEVELRAGWVVGADGTHSTVRRSLGLGFRGTTWPERWVAVRSAYDFSELGYEASTYQVDGRYGALVQRTAQGDRWRYLFADPAGVLDGPPASPSGEVDQDLQARISGVLLAVLPADAPPEFTDVATGRMYERTADHYRVGRVALVGHAAHVANPLTAFGVAAPYLDACALLAALVPVASGDVGAEALDAYAAERRRAFLEVAAPGSADRKHVVFQIADPGKLDAELEVYRQAAASPAGQRAFLLSEHQLGAEG